MCETHQLYRGAGTRRTQLSPLWELPADLYRHYLSPLSVAGEETPSKHENSIEHKSYVKFLNKAIQPALPFLKPGMKGLDYGCGPVPLLSLLLGEAGYEMDNYDPYFFPKLDERKKYDFIFATECFEHFSFPAKDLQRLKNLLQDDGLLIVMTERWKEVKDFKRWYYAKDPKHVAFYHSCIFDKICSKFGFERQFMDDSIMVILQRKPTTFSERATVACEEAPLNHS